MLKLKYTYSDCIKKSEQVQWKIKDIIEDNAEINFSKPFLPLKFFKIVEKEIGLSENHALILNQLIGCSYLNFLAYIDDTVTSVMQDILRTKKESDPIVIRALARYVEEEVKHQTVFNKLFEMICEKWKGKYKVFKIDKKYTNKLLSQSKLGTIFLILHLEISSFGQCKSVEKTEETIESHFKKLLELHWAEEAQHTKISFLQMEKELKESKSEDIEIAMDAYYELLVLLDKLLLGQTKVDIKNFNKIAKVGLGKKQSKQLQSSIHQCYRDAFIKFSLSFGPLISAFQQIGKDQGHFIAALKKEF